MADRNLGEVTVGGKKAVIRELTVSEIRAWLAAKSGPVIDVVDAFLFEDLALSDIPMMSDISADEIDNLAPSQIDDVIAKIKEVNPRFFEMQARIAAVGKAMLKPESST